MSPRIYMVSMIIIAAACQAIWRTLGLPDNVLTRSLSSALVVAGLLVDRWSTIRMLRLIEIADQRGVDHGFYESNPLIGQVQRVEDFTRSLVVYALDCGVIALSAAFPWFGIAVCIKELYAARSNTIQRRELLALVARDT